MKYILPILCFAIILAPHAQERTAAGSAETQMSWSALSNQISGLNTRTNALTTRIDQSVICGRKGKTYAPAQAGADADGCLEPMTNTYTNTTLNSLTGNVNNLISSNNINTSRVNNIIACNAQGRMYNGSSCIDQVE